MKSLLRILFPALIGLMVLTGCPPRQQALPPWTGPTLPMLDVVREINANNAKIHTIWARHDFEALIYDDKGHSHSFSGSGSLQFRKPGDLLLKAGGVIDFFEVGSNEQFFWFTGYPKEVSAQWWGRRDAAISSTSMAQIPIRPDLLVEVLGVHEIDTDFMRAPVPMMRFNRDARAYMMVWSMPVAKPARWAAVKEVWYDVETKKPRLILLFDEDGRIVLRAYLTEHKAIEGMDAQMATRYDLFFPANKSQLSFHLTTVKEKNKKGPTTFPNDSTFVLPEDPGVEKRIEIR